MGRTKRKSAGKLAASLVGGVALLAVVGSLWAHAVVVPGVSRPGSYETYTLRVPNEKDIATTRVEIRFPVEVFVVSFEEVPGWALEVRRDDTGRATGAVWTGTLAPGRFVQLPFVAVNPKEEATLVWVVDQTYGDDDVVSWAGGRDAEFPASRTAIVSPPAAPDTGNAAAATDATTPGAATPLTWVALFLSAAALVVAVRAVSLRGP